MRTCLAILFSVCFAVVARAEAPIHDIPKLDKIVLDGKADDWGDRGFRVDLVADRKGQVRPLDEFDAKFRLGWNDEGLLVLVTVKAKAPVEAAGTDLWSGDSIEMFVAATRQSRQYYQVDIAPGVDSSHPELRKLVLDKREKRLGELEVQAARTKTADGYVCEVLLPWKPIGVDPKTGPVAAFQIYVNYYGDQKTGKYQVTWHPYNEAHHDPNAMENIRLADKASPPVTTLASALDTDGQMVLTVIADKKRVGRKVTITLQDKTVGEGELKEEGGRALLRLPMPAGPLQDWVAHIGKETLPVVKRHGGVHFQAY